MSAVKTVSPVSRQQMATAPWHRVTSGAIVPHLTRHVQAMGRTGVAGTTLVVFAIAFFVAANSPLKHQLTELQARADDARRPHVRPRPSAADAARDEVQALLEHLPRRSELPALTDKVVTEATAARIALQRGTYDFSVSHSGGLIRARMTFPVHGRYPDIRRFIDATLAAIPGAAVDGLRVERKEIGAGEVDADIRFAVWLRNGS